MPWGDRAIGIAVGLIVGVVAVILFVFLGSQETIDAPSLDRGDAPAIERPAQDDGR